MALISSNPDPFSRALEFGDPKPSGYLARDNVRTLCNLVEGLLFKKEKARRYTLIVVDEFADWKPHVTTGVEAKSVRLTRDRSKCLIRIADTCGVWDLTTGLDTEPECGAYDPRHDSTFAEVSDRHLLILLRNQQRYEKWLHLQLEEAR